MVVNRNYISMRIKIIININKNNLKIFMIRMNQEIFFSVIKTIIIINLLKIISRYDLIMINNSLIKI
jgi:hypothetical protein